MGKIFRQADRLASPTLLFSPPGKSGVPAIPLLGNGLIARTPEGSLAALLVLSKDMFLHAYR
ncbi:hypothetical protein GCM10009077_20570 [Roseibium denhamense]